MRWFSPKSSSLRPVRHGHLHTMQLSLKSRASPAVADTTFATGRLDGGHMGDIDACGGCTAPDDLHVLAARLQARSAGGKTAAVLPAAGQQEQSAGIRFCSLSVLPGG